MLTDFSEGRKIIITSQIIKEETIIQGTIIIIQGTIILFRGLLLLFRGLLLLFRGLLLLFRGLLLLFRGLLYYSGDYYLRGQANYGLVSLIAITIRGLHITLLY